MEARVTAAASASWERWGWASPRPPSPHDHQGHSCTCRGSGGRRWEIRAHSPEELNSARRQPKPVTL